MSEKIKKILPKVVDVETSEPLTHNDLVYPTKMVEESMQWCIDNIPGFEEMSTLNRLYALNEINNTNTRVVKDNIKKNLDLEIERQEVKRIIKNKVVEKNNTASARNKSQDQIKADKQFGQLFKPERLKKGSTINRTTTQTLNAWTKVNMKIVERHHSGYYNGLGLRGKQVEKWICLYNNNFDREKTATELGIQEDSLRKSMKKITEAMHEIFIETFDEKFNENPILKSNVIEYFSSELNNFYK